MPPNASEFLAPIALEQNCGPVDQMTTAI